MPGVGSGYSGLGNRRALGPHHGPLSHHHTHMLAHNQRTEKESLLKIIYSWSSPYPRLQSGQVPPTPQAGSQPLMVEAGAAVRAQTPLGSLTARPHKDLPL